MAEQETHSATTFPPVRLDTTLRDLLLADVAHKETTSNGNEGHAEPRQDECLHETLCHVKPTSNNKIGSAVIVNDKYLLTSDQSSDGSVLAHLQLENCSHLLMFFAGSMNVIFIGCDDHCPDDPTLGKDAVDENARRSFAAIAKDQRPKVNTYANMKDLTARYAKDFPDRQIRWGFAIDSAEQLPYVFHPDLTYMLNSKRWLGASELLKSANDVIIDVELLCPKHQVSSKTIQNQGSKRDSPDTFWYFGGPDCKECEQGMGRELTRIVGLLNNRPVPFVLKLNQSLSSVGTVITVTEPDRPGLIEVVLEHLKLYLPRISKENAHLFPISLVMTDFIKADTVALNFYVRGGKHAGESIFLGGCTQLATGQGGRQTTMIRYPEQEKMEKRFRQTLDKMGKPLARTGYYGAAGADVMEDGAGNKCVIDLNVRTSLSHVLYLLKGHLHNERGYGVALIYECLVLTVSRDEFEKRMVAELHEAKVIIIGCAGLGDSGNHAYGLVVAGDDQDEMERISDKMFAWEA